MTPVALARGVAASLRPLTPWLPLVLLCSAVPYQAAAATLVVYKGGDLQAALNAAQPGDEVVIEAGGRFVGQFVLPVKPSGPVITVRSSATLPERRLTPADAALLPTLVSDTVEPALRAYGTADWRLDGLRFESTRDGHYNIVALQDAVNITMDRLLIIGGTLGQRRAIMGNGRGITLTRSHIANIWRTGEESQAFCAWDGGGPYTIRDNYLEAASQGVMFGGANSASPANVPADILVEGNHITKPLTWKGLPRVVKNLFELKSAKRALIRDNVMENNWSDGQNGYGVLFTVRNDEGGAPWSVVEDVVFERNVVRNSENGINVLGRDSYQASGRTTRVTIRHNLIVTPGTFLQVGAEIGVLTLDHNTVRQGHTFVNAYAGDVWAAGTSGPRPALYAVETLVMTNNLANHNDYGFIGDGAGVGLGAITTFVRGLTWTHNVLAGEAGWSYAYPVVTWQPAMADHLAQFASEGTLVSTSTYRGAANDATDLGWNTSVTATTPTEPTSPPPPVPTPAVDTTAPQVTVKALARSVKMMKYRVTAIDASGISSIQVWFANTLVSTAATSPLDVDLPVKGLARGAYLFTVVATDGAGNATTVNQTVSIK